MTFAEMKTSVRRQLDESGTVFYADDDIEDAINDGYAEMADVTEFFERQANIPILKKRTYFDLSTILTDTFLSPRRVYDPTASRWLEPTDTNEMDRHSYRQWELTEGTPVKMLMRGNWWFGVWPKDTTNHYRPVRMYYTSIPDALTDDDEEPQFDREFHPGLVSYALSDLLGQARETKKALAHWAAFVSHAQRLKDFVEGRTTLARVNTL